jgi:hypothetical protein
MWQDLVRLGAAWGASAGLIAFWYYVLKGIGTF